MKYAIVDMIRGGDCFEEVFDTQESAISKAEYEWGIMSEYDKKRREWYAVVETELDEDGCVDLDTAKVIKQYK